MNTTLLYILATLFFSILSIGLFGAEKPIRNEMSRYTLLHDRVLIMRHYMSENASSFFNFHLTFSSGLKKLFSDVKEATQNDSQVSTLENDNQKQVRTYKLMTRYLNTEYFVDAQGNFAFPLPALKYNGHRILLNPFYSYGLGSSFSFSNKQDARNPNVGIYLRKEKKLGVRTLIFPSPTTKYLNNLTFLFYELRRSDLLTSVTSSHLAQKGKIFDLNDLKKEEITWDMDISSTFKRKYDEILCEINEFKLAEQKKRTQKKTFYGNKSLYHFRYTRHKFIDDISFSPLLGLHYRSRYHLDDAIYAGFLWKPLQHLPLDLNFLIDNQTFLLMPQLKTKWFEFTYAWRSPHQNPHDDFWMPAQHTLEINFPFP